MCMYICKCSYRLTVGLRTIRHLTKSYSNSATCVYFWADWGIVVLQSFHLPSLKPIWCGTDTHKNTHHSQETNSLLVPNDHNRFANSISCRAGSIRFPLTPPFITNRSKESNLKIICKSIWDPRFQQTWMHRCRRIRTERARLKGYFPTYRPLRVCFNS